jgi:uncharacterized protein (TIGR03437 family)
MVSSNQINVVVPVPPASPSVYTLAAPNAWVQVVETTGTGGSATVVTTSWFPVTFVPEVPGVFTFGGLGLGQAAVLNYDATAGYSINSSKNPAPKGSTISLYVTGMGDLTAGSTITVTDSSSPKQQSSQVFPLIIDPAPAVTATLTPTPASISAVQSTFSVTALQAVGGTPPYIWTVTSGLPAGMTLTSSGLLSGSPTTTGTRNYTGNGHLHRHCHRTLGDGRHQRARAGCAVRGLSRHHTHGHRGKGPLHVVCHRLAGGLKPQRRRSPDRHALIRRLLCGDRYGDG